MKLVKPTAKNKPRSNGKHPGGRPPRHGSVDTMQPLIDQYFLDCTNNKIPYTVTGLAHACGFVNRQALIEYCERGVEFATAIKRAKGRVEGYAECLLLSGGNAAGAIFALKNHGWRDTQDIRHTVNLEDLVSGE